MKITLGVRTAETAALYFEKPNCEIFRKVLPQKAKTKEEAVADFYASQRPDADSFGRIIYADEQYIGDIWCYCIDSSGPVNAMVSYCVFEPSLWGQGAATQALRLFLPEITLRYGLAVVGAFTYADNLPSIRVLEKNGFRLLENFVEDGVLSSFFQLDLHQKKV